jgi:hypothetical protein
LKGDELGRAFVEWDLVPLRLRSEQEVRYLNSHSSLDDVPSSAEIELDGGLAHSPVRVTVFLCHSSSDKQAVRELDARLRRDGWVSWLDERDILPGEDWAQSIRGAVKKSNVVLVCLSKQSVAKAGFLQREIRFVVEAAEEQPNGAIFIIPVKLESCDVPEQLTRWQWLDYFVDGAHDRLLASLRKRAAQLAAS